MEYTIIDNTDRQVVTITQKDITITQLLEEYYGTSNWYYASENLVFYRPSMFIKIEEVEIDIDDRTEKLTIITHDEPVDFDKYRKCETTEPKKPDVAQFKMDFANYHKLPYRVVQIKVDWEA